MEIISRKKSIGIFGICMFSIIAVDSVRALPINALYGPSLVSLLLLGGVFFLLPCAFICAEMASAWPQDGGLYVWIREAFGKRVGFVAAWLLWIYNIIWFPTIIAFICATAGTAVFPNIMQHKVLLLLTMVVFFWLVTAINCFGVRASSFMSTLGTVIGTLLPMMFIIVLGAQWVLDKQAMAITLSWRSILPGTAHSQNLGLLPSMIFGLVGIEVSASFAGSVKNPQRNFPIAMLLSAVVILVTLILGSLTLAVVVPAHQLNLATGVVQAFTAVFARLGCPHMTQWMILCIFLGSLGGLSTWMAGPTRNMMIAAQDGVAPAFISKPNRYGAASNMLLCQAVFFTILCLAYVLFPDFNSAYGLLSDMTGELSILVYVVLFSAAIRLRYVKKEVKRTFALPGGNVTMWIVSGLAVLTCLTVFVLGFIPPDSLKIVNVALYEVLLIGVIGGVVLSGVVIAVRSE